jgi:hypothetical protein
MYLFNLIPSTYLQEPRYHSNVPRAAPRALLPDSPPSCFRSSFVVVDGGRCVGAAVQLLCEFSFICDVEYDLKLYMTVIMPPTIQFYNEQVF